MPPPRPTDPRLRPGSLYIMLFVRTPDVADGFHWALYHHRSSAGRGRGWKYHIRTLGDGWVAGHAQVAGVMGEAFLVGLIRIGASEVQVEMDAGSVDEDGAMRHAIESVPHDAPPPGYDVLTCRTWVLAVVRALVGEGIVKAGVGELERDVKAWGATHHADACNGVLPRVVADSRVCELHGSR